MSIVDSFSFEEGGLSLSFIAFVDVKACEVSITHRFSLSTLEKWFWFLM